MTPVNVIRAKCLYCCLGKNKEVRLCPAEECSLWVYRFGNKSLVQNYFIGKVKLTPRKAIKQKCLDCCGEVKSEIKNCDLIECPLFWHRFGKRPKLEESELQVLEAEPIKNLANINIPDFNYLEYPLNDSNFTVQNPS